MNLLVTLLLIISVTGNIAYYFEIDYQDEEIDATLVAAPADAALADAPVDAALVAESVDAALVAESVDAALVAQVQNLITQFNENITIDGNNYHTKIKAKPQGNFLIYSVEIPSPQTCILPEFDTLVVSFRGPDGFEIARNTSFKSNFLKLSGECLLMVDGKAFLEKEDRDKISSVKLVMADL